MAPMDAYVTINMLDVFNCYLMVFITSKLIVFKNINFSTLLLEF